MPQQLFCRERPQFAVYPGNGSFYRRHFDNPKNLAQRHDNKRRATILFYLNERWDDSKGGQLRLLLRSPVTGLEEVTISPQANKCVVFFSDLVEHEVLAAHAHRMAITVWLSECGSVAEGGGEKDQLSREFFKLACQHALHERVHVAEPDTTEQQPGQEGKLSREDRLARLPVVLEAAKTENDREGKGEGDNEDRLDETTSAVRCEQVGSVGCTGTGITLVEVAYEGRAAGSQPTRRLASLCEACAGRVAIK
jgi:hypothetical protein